MTVEPISTQTTVAIAKARASHGLDNNNDDQLTRLNYKIVLSKYTVYIQDHTMTGLFRIFSVHGKKDVRSQSFSENKECGNNTGFTWKLEASSKAPDFIETFFKRH